MKSKKPKKKPKEKLDGFLAYQMWKAQNKFGFEWQDKNYTSPKEDQVGEIKSKI